MSPRRIHLIGIGGIGLSAIARVLLANGDIVSGSDVSRSQITDELERLGARIAIGHRAENIGDAEIVLVTSAAPPDNPEVQQARRRGISLVKRYDFFPELTSGKKTIAIAGTHGKTTTTGMIAAILLDAGLDPTAIVGGIIPELGGNAHAGRGEYFVVEADEYDHAFLGLRPTIAVVTSIEMDHPDIYTNVDDVAAAFRQFLQLVAPNGSVIGCGDHERVEQELRNVKQANVTRYGLGHNNDWRADEIVPNSRGGSDFSVWHGGTCVGTFTLQIPGRHNVLNALAALAVADAVGVETASARETLSNFKGAERRFQVKGEVGGVVIVDDYAHHPSEIRATLAAARQRYPGQRLWAVFQPHTFTRTLALLDDFAQAFSDADRVVVADIFAARERVNPGISSRDLVRRIKYPEAIYIPQLDQIVAYCKSNISAGDVLVTLGAGDIYRVGEQLMNQGKT
jgi:UDP-N-acetylmuramate--alanine ligase